MNPKLSFTLGTPEHGWLPVELHCQELQLSFDASDVLNDPVEELLNVLIKLQDKEKRRVTWWLEPGAYFFDFEKSGEEITLSIIETSGLNRESAEKRQLMSINGNAQEMLKPFRSPVNKFYAVAYEEKHWPYQPDKNKIANL